jgi:hypothetical protein
MEIDDDYLHKVPCSICSELTIVNKYNMHGITHSMVDEINSNKTPSGLNIERFSYPITWEIEYNNSIHMYTICTQKCARRYLHNIDSEKEEIKESNKKIKIM